MAETAASLKIVPALAYGEMGNAGCQVVVILCLMQQDL